MKIKSTYITLLIVSITFVNCSQYEENLSLESKFETRLSTEQPYREGDLVLGKQLKNPYTVQNMAAAARYLSSKGFHVLDPERIKASHYYVKFMPADSAQFEQLDADKNLTLYPYPLDYVIVQRGNHYRDPSTPKDGYAYQYASVKVDYQFNPRIPYDIISPLFIPEEDAFLQQTENEDYLDRLLDRAYIQTENYADTLKKDKGKSQKSSYHPGGQIRIFDTRLNQLIGLEGVDMRARRWFTTYHARTDFNGDYEMTGSFKRPCNYSLWFSQEDFAVRPHLIALTAWIDGPKEKDDWDYDILSGYDRFAGHVFRGAYRYHYGFIDGLKRPFRPSGNRTIYIGKNDSKDWSGINYMVLPVIKIARYDDDNVEYDSDELFSTTCHETAHSSHAIQSIWGLMSYAISTEQIRESWAIGVEWWLTRLEYKNTRGVPNYGNWNYDVHVEYPNWYGYQYWNKLSYSDDYTSLFINIVDDYNDSFGFANSPDDEVSGYTFSQLENEVMYSAFSKNSVADELKKVKPAGITDQQIDKLISYY